MEQVLVLADVALRQNRDGAATPSEIKSVFLAFRIPPPANISEYLNRLAKNKLVVRLGSAKWALTPEGGEAIRNLMIDVTKADLQDMSKSIPEATFGDAAHHLIPPQLAPASFQAGIARFLEGHPFDTNVLCITRFPRSETDPVAAAINACREACREAGLELHLASDRSVADLLFGNVAAAMWASRFGIAILENRTGEGLRHNVTLEVGGMLATGRRCLLLRDTAAPDMPTDLIGHIYEGVDIGSEKQVRDVVLKWAGDVG